MSLVWSVTAGAAALAPRRFDETVDLAVATLHVSPQLLLGLGSEGLDLFRRLGPHRRQELLGGNPRRLKLLFTPPPSLRAKTLSLALGIGHHLLRPRLCLAQDIRSRGLQTSLIDDRRGFSPSLVDDPRGFSLCLSARERERLLPLSTSLLERYLSFAKKPRGLIPIGLRSQASTLQSRLSLQAAALDELRRLRLPFGRRALTRG